MANASVVTTVGEGLLHAYRDLVPAEARLAERLAAKGLRLRSAVAAAQWPVLHDHLHLYARGTSPAGMLVLGGRPDAGSCATGIPFTGAPEARRVLGLDVAGATASPSGAAFWRAVDHARGGARDAPMEEFFSTVHLAHAVPFDAPPCRETDEASAQHLRRLLAELRPQAIVTVGVDALGSLAHALRHPDLRGLASAGESAWLRWPPGSALHAYPWAQTPGPRPFRFRLVPVPALDGPLADLGFAALAATLAHACQ